MRGLVAMRVKPYYLHQGDLARGTAHFRVPIEEGQAILESMRGAVSGLCQPSYVLDVPGGHGKVPIGPSYLTPAGERKLAGRGCRRRPASIPAGRGIGCAPAPSQGKVKLTIPQ